MTGEMGRFNMCLLDTDLGRVAAERESLAFKKDNLEMKR